MGSLFTSMVSTAGAMRALQSSLNVVQNNIVNASTVGYARQEATLVANPFNPHTSSTSGGVTFGAAVRFSSKPKRLRPRTTKRSSSAPA